MVNKKINSSISWKISIPDVYNISLAKVLI